MQKDEINNEDIMDIKSPYIKTYNKNLDEIRAKIAERKSAINNSSTTPPSVGVISRLNLSDMRAEMERVSKKVVGGEIKKFAELASKEIEAELLSFEEKVVEDIDKKLSDFEMDISNKISNKIGSEIKDKFSKLNNQKIEIYSDVDLTNEIKQIKKSLKESTEKIENDILETVLINNEAVEEDINNLEAVFINKLNTFNQKMLEIEERLNNLELYSVENINDLREDISFNLESAAEEKNIKAIEKIEENIKENIKEVTVPVKDLETDSDMMVVEVGGIENDLNAETDEDAYVEKKLKNIINLFSSEGLLFRKNLYNSHLKEANARLMVEDFNEYKNIEKEVRAKICNIIMELVKTLNLNIDDEETIHGFLQRGLKEEYKVKRKSFLKSKLESLEKLVGVK